MLQTYTIIVERHKLNEWIFRGNRIEGPSQGMTEKNDCNTNAEQDERPYTYYLNTMRDIWLDLT